MGEKRKVLITIIVLLCIFLPLTVIGATNNFKDKKENVVIDNPRHELFYKGHLWFYNEEGTFLNKYECQTSDCYLAKSSIDDSDYGIKYFKEGTNEYYMPEENFAFISDGDILLYNIKSGDVLTKYAAIKTYNSSISGKRVIVLNNEGKWGVLTMGEILDNNLPFEYDFIGLNNKVNEEEKIIADKFIVKKDNNWFIVSDSNEIISGYLNYPIIDYNDYYIISKSNNRYFISTFNNVNYFESKVVNDYVMLDNYIGIVEGSTLTIYDDPYKDPLGSISLNGTYTKLSLENNGHGIDIIKDGSKVQSIALR